MSARASEISAKGEGIAAQISGETDKLTTVLETQVESMEARAGVVARAVSEQTDRVSQLMVDKARESARTLAASADDISRALDSGTSKAINALEGQNERLGQAADDHAAKLTEKASLVADAIEEQTSGITQRLDAGATAISDALNQRSAEIANRLGENVSGITNAITEEAQRATNSVEASVERLSGRISTTLEDAENAIGARTETLSSALAARTRELNAMLASRGDEFSQMLDTRSAPLLEEIETKGRDLVGSIADSAQSAADRVAIERHNLQVSFDEASATAAQRVSEANEALRSDVGMLLSRVAQSNEVLKTLIEEAGSRLGAVQDNLSERTEGLTALANKAVGDLQTSSDLIEANLGRLSDISSSVLGDIGQISGQFQSQGQTLAAAAELIQTTQGNLDISAEQRQRTIEELAQGLSQRSGDIERQMAAFKELIDTTLGDAETRARDIGTVLARTSDTATQTLTSQLSNLSSAADEQSRRAAQVIRAASEGLAGEITASIEDASKRFSDATEQMRQSAKQVSGDLASTRAEMRKGIMELPEETIENTAALRRAVGDQIRSLKDLSTIVSETKSAYSDADELPARRPSQSNILPTSAPSSAAVTARPQTVREIARAPEPALPSVEPDFSAPQRGEQRNTGAASGSQSSGKGGWVSDLLARASKEDEPVAPSRDTNLNTITTDIANAMDHRAVDDMWQRYRAGERGLFSRSLYTVTGQSVFDQVRNKYQGDLRFRSHVDRYIQDFEQALADIARNDVSNTQTQGALISENGKVYTMLAHASGRLT